jgi:hypothetical protein
VTSNKKHPLALCDVSKATGVAEMTVSRVLRNRNVHGAAIGSFPSPEATTSMDQRATMRYLKNWTTKVGLLNLPPLQLSLLWYMPTGVTRSIVGSMKLGG